MDFKALLRAQAGRKAIPAHPALLDPNIQVRSSDRKTPLSQREAPRHLNAYGGRQDAIDWVMDCVRLIVETASQAEYFFEDEEGRVVPRRGPDDPTDTREAPILLSRLIEEPNPYMAYAELIELTLIDYLLVGNAYWLKWRTNDEGQPLALYRLAPPFVKVVPGPFGVEGYEYQLPGQKDPLRLPTQAVVHFRQANPHSPHYGLGVIQGGSRMLDLELALTDTQAHYYENRAQPSMIVQSERRVPKDVWRKLQTQLRSLYTGTDKAGAMMVLEAGLKAESIQPSAAEAAFGPLTQLSRDRICAMFRVPVPLITGEGDLTSAQRFFDTKTMRPLLNKFEGAVSRGITQAWDLDFRVDYEYIMPIEERFRLGGQFASIPGVKIKEIRANLGLPPLGDERDEWVLNLPGEEGVEGDERRGIPDRNLPGEAGRPPLGENTARFPDDPNAALPPGNTVSKALSVGDVLERMEQLEAKAVVRTDLESRIQPPDDTLQNDREASVDGIVADTVRELKSAVHMLERGLLDELERGEKALGDRILGRLKRSESWRAFMGMVAGIMERSAQSALSASVIQQGRFGRIPDDELDYEALARELVYRREGVRSITDNLRDEVVSKVAKAIEEGETQADLERAIRESIDFWRESKAETVALTEATHAYNEGTLTVAERTGHGRVYVHDGEDHDEPCREANGQVWSIEQARANRLQHPRCRRAFTPIP